MKELNPVIWISVFCRLHPELIPAPQQKCFIDSVKRNDYPKYILSSVAIWVYKIPKVPPSFSVIQNLLSNCSESEFYHYYALMWEASFLFTDETQHNMIHVFSCKHYTYTFLVKSIILPTFKYFTRIIVVKYVNLTVNTFTAMIVFRSSGKYRSILSEPTVVPWLLMKLCN